MFEPWCELCVARRWPAEGHRKCCDECPGDQSCPNNAVCMCGDSAEHSSWVGHVPVSVHDYYRHNRGDWGTSYSRGDTGHVGDRL